MELTKEEQMQELQALNEELKAENAQLRKDKERLDWIVTQKCYVSRFENDYLVLPPRTPKGPTMVSALGVGKTARAAIDAAMANSPDILKGDVETTIRFIDYGGKKYAEVLGEACDKCCFVVRGEEIFCGQPYESLDFCNCKDRKTHFIEIGVNKS